MGACGALARRLPLGLNHTSAATLDGHVYVAGGHRLRPRYGLRLFPPSDGSSWTEAWRRCGIHVAAIRCFAAGNLLYVLGGNNAGWASTSRRLRSTTRKAGSWSDFLPALPSVAPNHVAGSVHWLQAPAPPGGVLPATVRVDCFDTQSLRSGPLPRPAAADERARVRLALEDGRAGDPGRPGRERDQDHRPVLPSSRIRTAREQRLGAMLVLAARVRASLFSKVERGRVAEARFRAFIPSLRAPRWCERAGRHLCRARSGCTDLARPTTSQVEDGAAIIGPRIRWRGSYLGSSGSVAPWGDDMGPSIETISLLPACPTFCRWFCPCESGLRTAVVLPGRGGDRA